MRSENVSVMRAEPPAIYALAAAVERWPVILPHYRWVRVLRRDGNRRLVAMAASRDGIPVSWRALQVNDPATPRITFRHVGGITRGMEVEWSFTPLPDGTTRVAIRHDLDLKWPLIGGPVADHIVGPLFIENIAGKTLRRIKELAEQSAVSRQPSAVSSQPVSGGEREAAATGLLMADR